MTVRENLDLGRVSTPGDGVGEDLERVFDLFPRLKERERQKAGTMSGGEQQMLAIGRALMARPKLLMLDEPSMGIAPILVQRIYETIAEINRQGVAILLVEQNANYALDVAKRGYVLETGQVVLANESDQLRDDPAVQQGVPGHMIIFAVIGAKALYLLFVWLISAVARLLAVRAQGLWRAARAGVRPDPVGHRTAARAAAAGAAGVEMDGGGTAAEAQTQAWLIARQMSLLRSMATLHRPTAPAAPRTPRSSRTHLRGRLCRAAFPRLVGDGARHLPPPPRG